MAAGLWPRLVPDIDGSTAVAAKGAAALVAARRRPVKGFWLALGQLEIVGLDEDVGGKGAAARPSAIVAMANAGDNRLTGDLVSDRAAVATACTSLPIRIVRFTTNC